MATIAFTNYSPKPVASRGYRWNLLTTTDADGAGVGSVGSGDRTVQVTGTFGVAGTIIFEGSLEQVPVNWFPLRDPTSTAISFTAAGGRSVLENVLWIRPRVTGGDGTTSLDVRLLLRDA